jgi:hypothetical protein
MIGVFLLYGRKNDGQTDSHYSIPQGNQVATKKNIQEIPTPQFDAVDTYERDYTCTFAQPTCYIRGRGGFFLIASNFYIYIFCLRALEVKVINLHSQS